MTWSYCELKKIAPSCAGKINFEPNDKVWHLNLDQIESGTGEIIEKKIASVCEAGNSTYRFDTANVLYSKLRPYLNKVVCPDEIGIATTELVPLRPNSEILDRKFLAYFLRSSNFLNYISNKVAGAKMPRVIMTKFWEYKIPVPPISEQHKIVKLLDQANKLVKLRVDADNKLEDMLITAFYKNFGNPFETISGSDYSTLGELLSFNPKQSEIKGLRDHEMVSFVPMNSVDERFGRIIAQEHRSLAEVKRGFTYFRENDVLFAKITPCMENGKTAIARKLKNNIGFGSTEFHVLRPKKMVTSEWIWGLIRLPVFRKYAKQKFTGAVGQQRVPIDFLKNFLIKKPSEKKLLVYASFFKGIINHIEKIEQVSKKLEKLFSILSYQAFTGKLTATWCEKHADELLSEIEIQTKVLSKLGK